MRRARRFTFLATTALAAAALVPAAAPAAAPDARIAGGTAGAIDADIRSGSGRLLGHLHGHLAASGRGSATFRPVEGARQVPLIVGLRGRRAGSETLVAARARGLRIALRITPRKRVSGSGTLAGANVSLLGAAGEDLPRLRRGMKMLVVGRPRGEGFRALRRMFRPVRFHPRRHARHRLLRERDEFHSFAAIVFGAGVNARGIRGHRLLRAFYGAGKWVVVAPATLTAQEALEAVHPFTPGEASPLLAVRAVGPEGSHQHVRPTLLYPRPAGARLSQAQRRTAAARRAAWFLGELRRLDAPHMFSARPSVRASQGGGNTDFNLPFKAAAIEIAVPYSHEFAFTRTQNMANYNPCAWNQTTYNAWCPDTWFWKKQSGGNNTAGCQFFLNNGYYILDRSSVDEQTTSTNSDGAYSVSWNALDFGFLQTPGNQCPADGNQTGLMQGNDYYYLIYDPTLQTHTLVVLSDPVVSASTSGRLAYDNSSNGNGNQLSPDLIHPNYPPLEDPRTLTETAWFLGQYSNSISLSGNPPLNNFTFEYSGQRSAPNQQITYTSNSQSQSFSQGFSIGVFGDQGTGSYSQNQTETASVTVNTPSWQVSPTPDRHSVTFTWSTNDPISWSTITGGGGGTFGLNPLNRADFAPANLATWTGQAYCCQLNVSTNRVLSLVDHFTRYDPSSNDTQDRFVTTTRQFGDSPNEVVPYTNNVAGPGLDLCDPAVMAPAFQDQCGGLLPAPTIAIVGTCGNLPTGTPGPFSFNLNGLPVGGDPPSAGGVPLSTYNCPGQLAVKPIAVDPDTAATVAVNVPAGLNVNTYLGCFQGDADTPFVGSEVLRSARQPRITVPAKNLPRGETVTCTVWHKTPSS